jgi:hypothetical protein
VTPGQPDTVLDTVLGLSELPTGGQAAQAAQATQSVGQARWAGLARHLRASGSEIELT